MTEQTTMAVRRSVTVDAPPERAFDVFTYGFSTWWPLETHHIGAAKAAEGIMEPRAGGRWYERDADGNECNWGYVTAFEPPHRHGRLLGHRSSFSTASLKAVNAWFQKVSRYARIASIPAGWSW